MSHRPKIKGIAWLPEQGCQRVLSIQGAQETPESLGDAVRAAGISWTWINVGDGRLPVGKADQRLREGLQELIACLRSGESVLIH